MFNYIKVLSTQRSTWFLLFISALGLELTALYFQHGMNLKPCVMCIYERVALLGILFAGIWGMIAPKYALMRLITIGLGLWGAIQGLSLSIKHVGYQLYPSPFDQCPIKVNFPATLPLDQWFPEMFHPTGLCNQISWKFLDFTMVQWLVFIFAVYTALLAIILISQILGGRLQKQRRLFR